MIRISTALCQMLGLVVSYPLAGDEGQHEGAVHRYRQGHGESVSRADAILHSDRGSQYTSGAFRSELKRQGLTQSLSGVAHCYENARMESFFATLKKELIYRISAYRRSMAEVKSLVFRYVFVNYDRIRVYTANPGGWPPEPRRKMFPVRRRERIAIRMTNFPKPGMAFLFPPVLTERRVNAVGGATDGDGNQAYFHRSHQNISKYVSYKDLKELMADLKRVHAAVDGPSAPDALEDFAGKWDKKYPRISKSWRDN